MDGWRWILLDDVSKQAVENGHMSHTLLAVFVAGSSDKSKYILHPRSSLLGFVCRYMEQNSIVRKHQSRARRLCSNS
jgi:hypothetical protein